MIGSPANTQSYEEIWSDGYLLVLSALDSRMLPGPSSLSVPSLFPSIWHSACKLSCTMRLGSPSEDIKRRDTVAKTSHGEETQVMAWDTGKCVDCGASGDELPWPISLSTRYNDTRLGVRDDTYGDQWVLQSIQGRCCGEEALMAPLRQS